MEISSDLRAHFQPHYELCANHGRYQASVVDEHGHERWFPGGCPQCRAEARVLTLTGRAAIPPVFLRRTLESFMAKTPAQRSALEAAHEYAANFGTAGQEWRNMILAGTPGTGKTHLACGIAQRIMQNGHSALFQSAAHAIQSIWERASGTSERAALNGLASIDLLILDELGLRFYSESGQAILSEIVNCRCEAGKATILLSNLPISAAGGQRNLRDCLGVRGWDRLREGGCKVVVFDWESYRGTRQITA